MSKSIRPVAYILLALLLVYSSYWFYLADKAEDYVNSQLSGWRKAGLDIRYSGLEVRGFPYRLVMEFDRFRAHMDGGPMDLSAETETLTAIAQPWNFRHVILEAEQISGDLSLADGAILDGPYTLASPRSSIRIDADGAGRMSLVGGALDWKGEAAGNGLEFHVRLPARADQDGTEGQLLAPLMAQISAEMSLSGAPGSTITYRLDAELRGPAPGLLDSPPLQAWRDAGGTLEIGELVAAGSFGALHADGSFSLDEAGRPLGILVVSAAQTETLLDGLQAIGAVPESQRDILEDQLMGSDRAQLPLMFQEGRILLGPLQLGELPRLTR